MTAPAVPTSRFQRSWQRWLRIAARIAHVQSHIILSLVYIMILAPIGFVFHLFRQDPFALSGKTRPSWWVRRSPTGPPDEFLRRMY